MDDESTDNQDIENAEGVILVMLWNMMCMSLFKKRCVVGKKEEEND